MPRFFTKTSRPVFTGTAVSRRGSLNSTVDYRIRDHRKPGIDVSGFSGGDNDLRAVQPQHSRQSVDRSHLLTRIDSHQGTTQSLGSAMSATAYSTLDYHHKSGILRQHDRPPKLWCRPVPMRHFQCHALLSQATVPEVEGEPWENVDPPNRRADISTAIEPTSRVPITETARMYSPDIA